MLTLDVAMSPSDLFVAGGSPVLIAVIVIIVAVIAAVAVSVIIKRKKKRMRDNAPTEKQENKDNDL